MALFALIPAAGQGTRLPGTLPKQYQLLAGQPLLYYSLLAFAQVTAIEHIYVVLASDDIHFAQFAWPEDLRKRCTALYVGGATRHQSVLNGLNALTVSSRDWILVHDAARPGLTPALLQKLIDAVGEDEVGGLLAVPVVDTLKQAQRERAIKTVAREHLWQAQTPQMFRYQLLQQALSTALQNHMTITDEASAVEVLGLTPILVPGHLSNFKITYPEDLQLAQLWLQKQ